MRCCVGEDSSACTARSRTGDRESDCGSQKEGSTQIYSPLASLLRHGSNRTFCFRSKRERVDPASGETVGLWEDASPESSPPPIPTTRVRLSDLSAKRVSQATLRRTHVLYTVSHT